MKREMLKGLLLILFSSATISSSVFGAFVAPKSTPLKLELTQKEKAPPSELHKHQITYLMQAKEVEKSIELYGRYKIGLKKHDFEVLQQMAFILLEQGARSLNEETQLLSIYGSGIAGASASLDILEAGLKSHSGQNQVAAIQFLGKMQDDRSDELLVKAMSSEFFFARMEAALYLAQKKHKTSVGHIESLMYRIPPMARFFFPQFFALIGTSEAISILRHLMEDPYPSVRVEAILSAARFGRDDLLPVIRSSVTHIDIAEQEAAAYALGALKDSSSMKKLKPLCKSSCSSVQIAAARALYSLGDTSEKEVILSLAKRGDLFAIATLGEILEGKELLALLCQHKDLAVRINAAFSLIRHRDPKAIGALLEILEREMRDIGLQPIISSGKTALAFKPVFSLHQQENPFYDLKTITLTVKEFLLSEAIHLPEEAFIHLADRLFSSRQLDLIPHLVSLLEHLQTPKSLLLLKTKAQEAGVPMLRTYCTLALYRLGEPGAHEELLKQWIHLHKQSELIRFRPLIQMDQRVGDSPHELTLEHHSRLLIEIYQSLADKQQESSIDILLDAIAHGNSSNRYVLAGLLLRTLQ